MIRNKIINKLSLECAALISNDQHITDAQSLLDQAMVVLDTSPGLDRTAILRDIIRSAQSSLEQTSDNSHMCTVRRYIEMAVDIGTNHFTKDMEEIIALDNWGNETDRYKSVTEAAENLGIPQHYISAVLAGTQNTTGGYRFIKAKDQELLRKNFKKVI